MNQHNYLTGTNYGAVPILGRSAPEKPKGHILVVDDEAALLALTNKFLLKGGYTTRTATSGNEGWDKFQQEVYDVVVTDYNMPGMTGVELLSHIYRVNTVQRAVLLSGNPGEAKEALDQVNFPVTHFRFLSKPYSPKNLLDIIAELTDVRAQ